MDWFNHLIPTIQSYGSFGYWLIFFIAFFETMVFIGSFIPGSFIIIFYGFLAASGYFNLIDLLILSTLGAVIGDGVSFYLGSRSKDLFHEKNFLLNTRYLEKGQNFFNKHGSKSIFWGRFIGIIKPFIPFVAGLSGMKTRNFIFWNVFSGIIWSVSHLMVGYFFGGAFKVIEVWTTRLGAFALIFSILMLVFWFSIKKGEKALEYTTSFIQATGWSFVNSFPIRWFYHKFPKTYIFIGGRMSNNSFLGWPLSLLISSLFVVLLCLTNVVKILLVSAPVVNIDTTIENILVVFRDSFLIKFFLCVTALGEAQIIISVALIITALFWLWKKRFYIMSLWLAIAGSAASAYIIKMLINRSRPGGNIPVFTEPFFSFPSGHAALIITLAGFLTYCIWRNFETWKIRVNSFFLLGAIILLVGFSRIYLGVHYFSDVIGGYFIGFLWLLFGIAMSEWLIIRSRKSGGDDLVKEIMNEKSIKDNHKILRLFTGLLIFAEVFYAYSFISNFKPIFNSVTQTAERRVVVLDPKDPLFEKYIPKFPENMVGDYQAPLNFIIIAASDESLAQSIVKASWLPAEQVGIKSFTKMFISNLKNILYDTAPVTPLFWHGQANSFAFEKPYSLSDLGARYEVRLWKTDISTEDGNYVYVGSVGLNTSIQYGILRKNSSDLDAARDELFTDMLNSGTVMTYERKSFVDNNNGQYYEKGKYVTDGKAYFVYLLN